MESIYPSLDSPVPIPISVFISIPIPTSVPKPINGLILFLDKPFSIYLAPKEILRGP